MSKISCRELTIGAANVTAINYYLFLIFYQKLTEFLGSICVQDIQEI